MLFMVIERFKDTDAVPAVYQRFRESGRMMPEGLSYVDSWIEVSFQRCFLVAQCDDPRLLQQWVLRWHDLIDFEIVPVVGSKDTAAVVAPSE
jgi:Protein of unknown function (DUF3303)